MMTTILLVLTQLPGQLTQTYVLCRSCVSASWETWRIRRDRGQNLSPCLKSIEDRKETWFRER